MTTEVQGTTTPALEDGTILCEFERPRNECIRVVWSHYRDQCYLNARKFYTDEAGEVKPTKQGASLRPEEALALLDALAPHRKQLERVAKSDADHPRKSRRD